jgi:hypothetical protein
MLSLDNLAAGWMTKANYPIMTNHMSAVTIKDGAGKERHYFFGGQYAQQEYCSNNNELYVLTLFLEFLPPSFFSRLTRFAVSLFSLPALNGMFRTTTGSSVNRYRMVWVTPQNQLDPLDAGLSSLPAPQTLGKRWILRITIQPPIHGPRYVAVEPMG